MSEHSFIDLTWFYNTAENGKLIFAILTFIIGTVSLLALVYLCYDPDEPDLSFACILISSPVMYGVSALFIMLPLLFIATISVVALVAWAAVKVAKFKTRSKQC